MRAQSETALVTRWSPIDVLCAGEIAVRVKLVRDENSAAMCIAEAVSHEVFRVIGLEMAECHAVVVGTDFAADITRQFGFNPAVVAGRHWGTTLLTVGTLEIDFQESHVAKLKNPGQLLTLYVADELVGNRDRRVHGNVLLTGLNRGKYSMIPIDQSEAFDHPASLRSPERLTAIRRDRLAAWMPGTENVVLTYTRGFVTNEVRRIQGLAEPITRAVRQPPDEWYDRSGVDPASVRNFLTARLENLAVLVDINYWENLWNAIGGGYVLDI